MRYDPAILEADFAMLQTLLLRAERVELDEGPCHRGEAQVIRYIGNKAF
jgi:hypothetical protein